MFSKDNDNTLPKQMQRQQNNLKEFNTKICGGP